MKSENEIAMNIVLATVLGACLILVAFGLCTCLTSCTYSVTLIHTDGQATDVVDEESRAAADIRPAVSLPIVP